MWLIWVLFASCVWLGRFSPFHKHFKYEYQIRLRKRVQILHRSINSKIYYDMLEFRRVPCRNMPTVPWPTLTTTNKKRKCKTAFKHSEIPSLYIDIIPILTYNIFQRHFLLKFFFAVFVPEQIWVTCYVRVFHCALSFKFFFFFFKTICSSAFHYLMVESNKRIYVKILFRICFREGGYLRNSWFCGEKKHERKEKWKLS